MYGRFQGGPQLDPPDAERRQSLGQLKSVGDVFPVWQSFYTEKTIFPKYTGVYFLVMMMIVIERKKK